MRLFIKNKTAFDEVYPNIDEGRKYHKQAYENLVDHITDNLIPIEIIIDGLSGELILFYFVSVSHDKDRGDTYFYEFSNSY